MTQIRPSATMDRVPWLDQPCLQFFGSVLIGFFSCPWTRPNRRTSMCSGKEWWAKFWLEPLVLDKAGGFKPHELNAVGKLVEENRVFLLEQWYEHFGR